MGCALCNGTGWVCEVHDTTPWDGPDACECGAAGAACRCNGTGQAPQGFVVLYDEFGDKRH